MRGERADGVHEAADGAAFLGHLDEEFAGLAVLEHADGDVAFVAGDLELVVEGDAGVGHAAADGLVGLLAQFGDFAFEFDDAAFERDAVVEHASTSAMAASVPASPHVLRLFAC